MNLSGKPPLGQKPPRVRKPKKSVRKVSTKRAAYLASDDRRDSLAHMARVKGLPCMCCNAPPPSSAHHVTGDGKPRNDMRVIPLCYDCHQGQNGYHNAKAAWVERYGQDYMMLDQVADLLR